MSTNTLIIPDSLKKYEELIKYVNNHYSFRYFVGYRGIFDAIVDTCLISNESGFSKNCQCPRTGDKLSIYKNYNEKEHGIIAKSYSVYFYLDDIFSVVENYGSYPVRCDQKILIDFAELIPENIAEMIASKIFGNKKISQIHNFIPVIFGDVRIEIDKHLLIKYSHLYNDIYASTGEYPSEIIIPIECPQSVANIVSSILESESIKKISAHNFVHNPGEFQKIIQILDFLGVTIS